MALTTPLLGVACHHRLEFDTVYLRAKFGDSIFSRSRDIIRDIKIWSGSLVPDHAPFKGDLSSLCWYWQSLCACKFDHSSFNRSGDGWCPPKFKWFTWPDHAPFRDSLPSMDYHLLLSTYLPNLKYQLLPTTKIRKAIQNSENGVVWGS